MSLLRPLSLWCAALFLFLFLAWFSMASVDYDKSRGGPSLTTAGWFILGFPFIAGFSAALGAVFAWIGRKSLMAGWIVLLAMTPLLCWSILSSLPNGRLPQLIGRSAAKLATLQRLRISDSFGDGSFTTGIISGPDNLLEQIVQDRRLQPENTSSLSEFQGAFKDEHLPEYGDVYRRGRIVFYKHAASGKIYFLQRFAAD